MKSLHQVATPVNTARSAAVATLRSVGKELELRIQQGRRLAAARLQAGYRSAREAALSNGWPESSYRAHEKGTRTIGQDDAERYLRRFRAAGASVTAQSVLFGDPKVTTAGAHSSHRSASIDVPLLSWVSAGRLADAESQIPVEDVPLLAFADLGRGDFFALRVSGDSMDRISPDGSIIVVNRADRELVPEKPYVFLHRGETTFKLWRANPDHLAPHSWSGANKPIFLKGKKEFEVIGRVRRTVLDL